MPEVNYSTALRCIAQDLAWRGLKDFTIKRDGSHFIVSSNPRNGIAAAPGGVRYTPADIEIMDRSGETRRGNQASEEFMHRAQILRAVGDYLDKYNSTLTSITYNDIASEESPLRVEYITREGEHVIDDRPGAALFDMCVLMFQKRSQMSPTVGLPRRPAR
jgi:hypothetical protein